MNFLLPHRDGLKWLMVEGNCMILKIFSLLWLRWNRAHTAMEIWRENKVDFIGRASMDFSREKFSQINSRGMTQHWNIFDDALVFEAEAERSECVMSRSEIKFACEKYELFLVNHSFLFLRLGTKHHIIDGRMEMNHLLRFNCEWWMKVCMTEKIWFNQSFFLCHKLIGSCL